MDHRPFVYGPINLPILSTRLPQFDLKERSHKCWEFVENLTSWHLGMVWLINDFYDFGLVTFWFSYLQWEKDDICYELPIWIGFNALHLFWTYLFYDDLAKWFFDIARLISTHCINTQLVFLSNPRYLTFVNPNCRFITWNTSSPSPVLRIYFGSSNAHHQLTCDCVSLSFAYDL